MIVGKQNILNWFNTLPDEIIFWGLYKQGAKESGYSLFKSNQNENLTKSDSYTQLQNILALMGYGKYSITAQKTPGNILKGAFTTDFEITMQDATGNNNNNNASLAGLPMVGMVSEDRANQIAEEKFNSMMREHELKELRKKVAELEKENKEYEKNSGGVWDQIGGLVLPHIMGKVIPMPIQQPLAQVGTLATETTTEVAPNELEIQQQKLGMVLQKTEDLFGEPAVPFLEKLINHVEQNPHFVGMIKGFIK